MDAVFTKTSTRCRAASKSSTRRAREPRPYLTVIPRRLLPDARVAQDPRVLREALGRRGRGRGAGQGRRVDDACASLPYLNSLFVEFLLLRVRVDRVDGVAWRFLMLVSHYTLGLYFPVQSRSRIVKPLRGRWRCAEALGAPSVRAATHVCRTRPEQARHRCFEAPDLTRALIAACVPRP